MRQQQQPSGRRRPNCFGVRWNLTTLLSLCVLSVIVFYVWCLSQMEWNHNAPTVPGERHVRAVAATTAPKLAEDNSLPIRPAGVQASMVGHIATTSIAPRLTVDAPTIHHRTATSAISTLTTTTRQPPITISPPTTKKPTTAVSLTSKPITSPKTTAKPTTTLKATTTPASVSTALDARFVTLTSFDATQTFLKSLDSPIFLFFTCGKASDTNQAWSPKCEAAEAAVLASYRSISPPHRLAIIQVGTSQEEGDASPFRSDFDILLHDVPSLMRYERNNQGYANTSFVLEGKSAANAALVEFAFTEGRSTGVRQKAVETISDYGTFRTMTKLFEDTAPMYLLFMSGSWPHNSRVWCVYCRYREAVVEFAFQKYAAPNAKLVKVQVAQLPAEWNKENPYKKLNVPHVPYMLIPHLDAFEMLFYQHYRGELDDVDMLRSMFERDAAFQAADKEVLNPGIN